MRMLEVSARSPLTTLWETIADSANAALLRDHSDLYWHDRRPLLDALFPGAEGAVDLFVAMLFGGPLDVLHGAYLNWDGSVRAEARLGLLRLLNVEPLKLHRISIVNIVEDSLCSRFRWDVTCRGAYLDFANARRRRWFRVHGI